jgi:enoyl-CoA hydratase/carnithine racemase
MAGELVRLEYDERVAEVVLASPPVNALSLDFLSALERAAGSIPREARAIVLRSDVPRIFMAGGDIAYMVDTPLEQLLAYVERLQNAFSSFERYAYPVLAAIEGHCLGGGLEIALCCDIRVVAESASLGVPEVTLGIFPAAGGTQRLPRAIGQALARDLLVTGRRITGREAKEIGLANHLVADGEATERARDIARDLAFGASEAIAATKYLALACWDRPLTDGLRLEREEWGRVRSSSNAQEGLRAFIEKRKPVYR